MRGIIPTQLWVEINYWFDIPQNFRTISYTNFYGKRQNPLTREKRKNKVTRGSYNGQTEVAGDTSQGEARI